MRQRALAPLMIGREPQLAELHNLLAQARAGQGQVIFIAGEAGVGKTRLLREFVRSLANDEGLSVFTGYCYDEHPAPPYGPFAEILRREVPSTPAIAELRRLLASLAPAGADAGDPQAERRRLFHAIHQALRPTGTRTHVLLLEDLHWSDEASRDLLLYLARVTASDRMLIVGSYRSDEMHRLHPLAGLIARFARDRRSVELRLQPLSRAELAEMLAATLGEAPAPELLAALYERTEGNPFFAEEVLEGLLAEGRAPDAGKLTLTIPISIKDSVLRRAAELDESTALALRAAAVIGRSFDFELLLRLSGMREAELLRSLAVLVERQLIAEEPGGPEDRYRFRHELIRAALYEEMLRRERRLRHLEVLRALEELHAANPAANVDQLAYHALSARALPEAARYSELAGDRASRVHAYREALGHYEAALEAGEQAGTLDEQRRGELLARLGHTAYLLGEPRRAADVWREALACFEALNQPRRVADIRRWLGRTAWDTGAVEEAFAQTRAALATLEGEGPSRELAMAYSALSHLHMFQIFEHVPGATAECIALGERALALADALGDDQVRTHALNNIGVALVDSGRAAEGLAYLERSLAIARAADLPADAVRAYINLGAKLCKVGRRPEGLALQREGYAYATRLGYIRGSNKLLISICYSELQVGEWQRLEEHLAEALRPGFPGASEERTLFPYFQALLLYARGQPAEACAVLTGLRAATTDSDEIFSIEELQSAVYAAMGEIEQALATADRVMEHMRGLLAPGAPLTTLGHHAFKLSRIAELYLEHGRRAEALEILAAQEAALGSNAIWEEEAADLTQLRGMVALEDQPAAAADYFAQAIAHCERLVSLPDVISNRRRRAGALLRLGTPDARAAAREELRAARVAAESLGFGFELARIAALEEELAPARATSSTRSARPLDGLTPRELEVLALITRGLSNRAIAEILVISEKTAEVHVRNILGKLGFSSRTQAATYAVERGIVARSA